MYCHGNLTFISICICQNAIIDSFLHQPAIRGNTDRLPSHVTESPPFCINNREP